MVFVIDIVQYIMEKIGILIDSTCDLCDEDLKKYGIKLIPLQVIYKDAIYRDRIDISASEVYDRFEEEIPSTSLPQPIDFLNAVEEFRQEGYNKIVCVVISKNLSGTYNMVQQTMQEIDDIEIELIDSKILSAGIGFVAIEIAKAIKLGKNFKHCIKVATENIKRIRGFFIVKSLKYLREGGRIGLVEGTIGEMLNIKPVITVNANGVYETYKKVRGRKKSLDELYKIIKEKSEKAKLRVGIYHGNALEEAHTLLDEVKKLKNVKETFFEQISPVLSVHTGPGTVGIIIHELLGDALDA